MRVGGVQGNFCSFYLVRAGKEGGSPPPPFRNESWLFFFFPTMHQCFCLHLMSCCLALQAILR